MSDVVVLSDCRSQGCRDWVKAGRPYSDSKPIAQFKATVSGHGFVVYTYPDKPHLIAKTPEDHTPFSATGFPTPAPRWIGNAADSMPRKAGMAELAKLARQIISDRNAGVAGTEWIKYMNWTDENGSCWHTSWQTGRAVTTRSTDKGHIHVSGLSTWVAKVPAGWDPVARMNGGGGTPAGGDDEDMGSTYIDGQVGDTSVGPRNVDVGIVAGGSADPRNAWLSFTNDTPTDYALRVVWTTGDNNYQPLAFTGAKLNDGYNGTVFQKGIRGWVQLPKNCVALSIIRQAIGADGKPVAPGKDAIPYQGSLSFAIERSAVLG
jgi:hypothetical protein